MLFPAKKCNQNAMQKGLLTVFYAENATWGISGEKINKKNRNR